MSISPLPAPAAQRNRQHVADALAAESRSTVQTPIQTPTTSLAPWAEKVSEVLKGPSLKEIQEAEARKAAAQEEIAANVRRAKVEAERNNQPLPPAPGLPSSSTWASAGSPSAQVPPSCLSMGQTSQHQTQWRPRLMATLRRLLLKFRRKRKLASKD